MRPWFADYLTREAILAVHRSDVLVGAQRLLDLFSDSGAERLPIGADIDMAVDLIAGRREHHSVAFW